MEEHHFQECITIINETRLFDMLNSTEYEKIDGLIRRSILATDLANYFKNKNQFQGLIESKTHNWSNQSHRNLTHDMLMTACDLNANVKPFEIQKRVAIKVTEEFYQEGDLLKKAFPDIQIVNANLILKFFSFFYPGNSFLNKLFLTILLSYFFFFCRMT